jgi:cytochrome c5
MEGQMKKYWVHISLGVLLLSVLPLASQTTEKGAPQAADAKKQASKASAQTPDGNQVFLQNCARCHTVPESFSPRIAGTVIRHMRVRAGLSAQDEKALLRFLNQ